MPGFFVKEAIDHLKTYRNDKGKPVERQRRKAMGLKHQKGCYDCQAAENGTLQYTTAPPPVEPVAFASKKEIYDESKLPIFYYLHPRAQRIHTCICTAFHGSINSYNANALPTFKAFVASVSNGSNQVTGVYVDGLFAYRVLQTGNAVPGGWDVVGQYGRAKNIGLLAHNYAAGANFFALTPGMKVKVIYGTGKVRPFTVKQIDRYQASNPNDFSAPFTNTQTGKQMSAKGLFKQMYSSGVTFQTCITNEGYTSWGLLFVRAK